VIDVLLAALLGLAHGVRHALEPDHVAALAAVTVGRASPRASVRYAAAWGFGHGAVLVGLGGACILLGTALPSRVTGLLELGVAVMLVWLGARTMREKAAARALPEAAVPATSRRAIAIGCVHGAAGTGAIIVLALAGAASRGAAVAAVALYAVGAALGMMILAGTCGAAIARFAGTRRATRALVVATSSFSVALGVYWAARTLAGVT
jgi:hypothetical protein